MKNAASTRPVRNLLAALLFLSALVQPVFATVFTVTSVADGGAGSLRMAMTAANINPGTDTIAFAVVGPSPYVIAPLSQLPVLTDQAGVYIDGYTQPGSTPGPNPPSTAVILITLDGLNAGASHGIWITSPNNTIRGLVVRNFQQDGIRIQASVPGTFFNRVEACIIGTNQTGTLASGNGSNQQRPWAGVSILADPATLGFAYLNLVRDNLVSANYAIGVSISSCPPADVFDNTVDSNYIGTTITGMSKLGNSVVGVYIGEAAHDNHVVRNVISGNDTDGVSIVGYVDPFTQWYTRRNEVRDNLIGLASDGMTSLPNGRDGVCIGLYAALWRLGFAPENLIVTNHIAYNGRNGVTVWEHPQNTMNTDRNIITRNSIYSNFKLGIDLNEDGVSANDAGDLDVGANQTLNTPVITYAVTSGGQDTIRGTLMIDTNPMQATVEIFKAQPCVAGSGQGRVYIGSATPDAMGNWTAILTGQLAAGDSVTATAIDTVKNTSEFSVTVATGAPRIAAAALVQFGTVTVTQQTTRDLTVYNTGTAPLVLSGTSIGPGAFTLISGGAPRTIAVGDSAILLLRFSPSAPGLVCDTLTITSNASNAPTLKVTLCGTGAALAPVISVSADTLDFGTRLPDSAAVRSLAIYNTGNDTLVISSASIGGTDSACFQLNSSARRVPAGDTLVWPLAFSAPATGLKTATLSIASNDPGTPVLLVFLRGTCVGSMANIGLSDTLLDFGTRLPGSATTRALRIISTGNDTLRIASLSLEGTDAAAFLVEDDPGPGAVVAVERTIHLRFTPAASGTKRAALAIASNDPNTPVVRVTLRGNCINGMPDLWLSDDTLDFGTRRPGTTFARSMRVGNAGTLALNISAQSITGPDSADFSLLRAAGSSIAAGSSDSLAFRFQPGTIGSKAAVFELTSDDPNVQRARVLLKGVCAASVPEIALGDTVLSFGTVPAGMSKSRTLLISNSGNAVLTIAGAAIGGTDSAAFSIATPQSLTIAPGGADSLTIDFTPPAIGAMEARLSIFTDDPNCLTARVRLEGTGSAPAPAILVAPTALQFGTVRIGSDAAATVRVSNAGSAALTILRQSIGGADSADFVLTRTCASSLPPGAADSIVVRFSPSSAGPRTSRLSITSSDPLQPVVTIPLDGAGTATPRPRITVYPTQVDFGVAAPGVAVERVVYLGNTGDTTLVVNAVTLHGPDSTRFLIVRLPGSTVAPGLSDSIVLRLAPLYPGIRRATVRIASNDPDAPVSDVPMAGIVAETSGPSITLDRSSIDFGSIPAGTTRDEDVTIRNTGASDLHITGQSIRGADSAQFSIVQPAPSTLAPWDSARLRIRHSPVTAGPRSATARLTSDDPLRPEVDIALSSTVVNVEDPDARPDAIRLGPAYPNPFSSETTIAVDIPCGCAFDVRIIDGLGRQIRTLTAGRVGTDLHVLVWDGMRDDGSRAANGLYFCTLTASGGRTAGVTAVVLRR